MGKLVIGAAVAVALALVVYGLVAAAARPREAPPRLVSMTEAAQAMMRDGKLMLTHGQAMLDEAAQTGDADLQYHGQHWLKSGQDMEQRGRWMSMDPLAPGNLVTSPSDLSRQGAWGTLPQTAQAMMRDPSHAGAQDLQALRWNGQAMLAEGRTMADQGELMAAEAAAMAVRHDLRGADAAELRQPAQTLRDVGGYLQQNGQQMIDYADRLRRSLGVYP